MQWKIQNFTDNVTKSWRYNIKEMKRPLIAVEKNVPFSVRLSFSRAAICFMRMYTKPPWFDLPTRRLPAQCRGDGLSVRCALQLGLPWPLLCNDPAGYTDSFANWRVWTIAKWQKRAKIIIITVKNLRMVIGISQVTRTSSSHSPALHWRIMTSGIVCSLRKGCLRSIRMLCVFL